MTILIRFDEIRRNHRNRHRCSKGNPIGLPGDELGKAEWLAEGAASTFDCDSDSETIAKWCKEVSLIPPEEFNAMIHSPRPEDDLSPRALLEQAALFVDAAMYYPGLIPKEPIERFRLFLPAPLLREFVGNPFRPAHGSS